MARRRRERGHEAYALQLLGEVTRQAPYQDDEQAAEYTRAAVALAESLSMRTLAAALAQP